ncbi:hypothetical protein NPS29_02175 [Pseudomonas putida]|uniref:hypothetical protein n=1 Tax=Pseudomonas putida TaxID=303 RepID=UPI002363A2C3|nr:hypothetical protein [Pseudomonas putida]MDD1964113.1 hypothetical protein [Pseudomonas putida]
MNTDTLEKVVLIHTRECFSQTCGHLMQESVARLKASDGCVCCQLDTAERPVGRWAIHCAWNSIDAMRASFEYLFQPAVDTLMAHDALLSIQVCDAGSAGASHS